MKRRRYDAVIPDVLVWGALKGGGVTPQVSEQFVNSITPDRMETWTAETPDPMKSSAPIAGDKVVSKKWGARVCAAKVLAWLKGAR